MAYDEERALRRWQEGQDKAQEYRAYFKMMEAAGHPKEEIEKMWKEKKERELYKR